MATRKRSGVGARHAETAPRRRREFSKLETPAGAGIRPAMRSLLPAFCAVTALLLAGCDGQPTRSGDTAKVPSVGASAAAPAQPSPVTPVAENEVAVFNTTEGELTIAFRSDKAPGTVANFKKLANSGFYNGTSFHRILKGFMVQGGDPKTRDASLRAEWGTGGPGYMIKAEFNDLHHGRGVISMARSNHPDSAGSQFFICDDRAGFLDGKYTAFGKVIKGDDVLEKILSTPVTMSAQGENSSPTKRVEIKSITILTPEAAK
jgi:peptidyl-prolyl cis-trans isomerase B (cyclophilin B)